jgi:hypothetical protein
MYQAAYTAESLAVQLKKPENRVEAVGRAACEAVGGKLVGGWYCFIETDFIDRSAIAAAITLRDTARAVRTKNDVALSAATQKNRMRFEDPEAANRSGERSGHHNPAGLSKNSGSPNTVLTKSND